MPSLERRWWSDQVVCLLGTKGGTDAANVINGEYKRAANNPLVFVKSDNTASVQERLGTWTVTDGKPGMDAALYACATSKRSDFQACAWKEKKSKDDRRLQASSLTFKPARSTPAASRAPATAVISPAAVSGVAVKPGGKLE